MTPPNSFGAMAVDCGASVGPTGLFVPPNASDAAALSAIVNTFQSQAWRVELVLGVRSAAEARSLVAAGPAAFAHSANPFLTDGLQLDMRSLAHDASLAGELSSFVLGLSAEMAVPLSVVVNGAAADGSDVPLDLKQMGAPGAAVTVVTTGSFTASVPELTRIVAATSDALGGITASQPVYAPGISISDEYDEFKPMMYTNWDKYNALIARNVSKVGRCVSL